MTGWWRWLAARRWFLWIAAVVMVIALLVVFSKYRGRAVNTARAERTRVVQTLVISGRVLALRKGEVGSQIAGIVERVAVEEGERVAAGQLLVQINDQEWQAAVAEARATVAHGEAALERARLTAARTDSEAAAQARLRARDAAANAQRLTALEKGGIVPAADAESARRQAAIAQSALESADAIARSTSATGSEQKAAEADLRQAREALAAAEARLALTSVRAPANGTILTRSVERGTAVTPGKALLTMTIDSETLLLAQPDERNLQVLHSGQPARASADAWPGQYFDATVWTLAPNVDIQRGTVDVKFRVPHPPPYLKTDMTVSIDIETGHKDQAVVVPIETVRGLDQVPWVFVIDGHRIRRREVTLGLRGDNVLEIVGGVAAGELVAFDAAGDLVDGARVHAKVTWPEGR